MQIPHMERRFVYASIYQQRSVGKDEQADAHPCVAHKAKRHATTRHTRHTARNTKRTSR